MKYIAALCVTLAGCAAQPPKTLEQQQLDIERDKINLQLLSLPPLRPISPAPSLQRPLNCSTTYVGDVAQTLCQ